MLTNGVQGDATAFVLVWLFERPFHIRLDINPCWTFVEDLDFCIPGAKKKNTFIILNKPIHNLIIKIDT